MRQFVRGLVSVASVAALLGACSPVERQAALVTPGIAGQRLSAGPGDIVMDVKVTKSLPNAFGNADLFGRTTDAGRVLVQYVGSHAGEARLVRQDTVIETNETTMNRTPIVSSRTETGRFGRRTTVTTVSQARIPPGYAISGAPVTLNLKPGQSVTVEGRTLTVAEVGPNRVDYTLN